MQDSSGHGSKRTWEKEPVARHSVTANAHRQSKTDVNSHLRPRLA